MFIRYGTAMSSASVITCSLLLLMTSLISMGNTPPAAEPPIELKLLGAAPPPEPKSIVDQFRLPDPPPPPAPLPSDQLAIGVDWTPAKIDYALPFGESLDPTLGDFGSGTLAIEPMQDSPVLIVSAVPPAYPSKLAARGIEGFVDVSYDVTAAGKAHNIAIVQSTHRGFESAALAATRKMRFKPRLVNGTAVSEVGLSRRFRFEMEQN